MSIAIRTKYLPITNHRGSRITAATMTKRPSTGKRERVTFGYYELDGDMYQKHVAAAYALAKQLDLSGSWYDGDDGAGGYVFVHTGSYLAPGAAFVTLKKVD